jgi:GNAT superfamily N-acetyltransferase
MECPECGMSYVPDIPEDVKVHQKYHDKIVNGVYARKRKSDKIIWEEGNYRITVVNYYSPFAQRKRAEEAGLVAHKDTPFDFAPYHSEERLDERNVHIFLLYRKNRIIGLLIVERRDYVQRFTWEEYENAGGKELPKGEPIWSIGLAWVHRRHRKRGLGSRLVQIAASFFDIEIQSIGWYTPFEDYGEKLVKSLCPESFYVAK